MKKIWLLAGTLVGLGIMLFILRSSKRSVLMSAVVPKETQLPEKVIQYKEQSLAQGVVHSLLIPSHSRFLITPALSAKVNTAEEFAHQQRAIAIINGGFFDPRNQKTTSVVVLQGKLVADPEQNERLVNNPDLKPYLDKILNRTEFRRYLCGQTFRYDIVSHREPTPIGCQLVDALGGGPTILPELTLVQEGFVDKVNRRDALGSTQPNARTAVGITHDGSIVLVMVAQKSNTGGMSLAELANLMKSLGAEKAMNLDGGSSSSFYYKGKSFYGKVDEQGAPVKRPVKSVLLVQELNSHQ